MFRFSLPQLRYTQQPCRARAPFVCFADIFPANGEIHPRQRGPRLRITGFAWQTFGAKILRRALLAQDDRIGPSRTSAPTEANEGANLN